MAEINVRKWDGRIEPFNREKIAFSITAAGLGRQEAEKIVDETEEWAEKNAADGIIDSVSLRAKVLYHLALVDREIAKRYVEFRRKAKEKT